MSNTLTPPAPDVRDDRAPFPSPDELDKLEVEAFSSFGNQFSWKGKRLVALNREIVDKLERKRYSASAAKSIAGCSARWAYERIAEIKGPFNDAVLGTAVHTLMEYLLELPPLERTLANADRFIDELAMSRWPESDDMPDMERARVRQERARWIEEVRVRYAGYMAARDLTKIKVIKNEMKLEGDFMGVPTIAYLDRVDDLSEEFGPGMVGIVDYKTSKKVPNLRYGDDHGDQQRTYKAFYESIHGEGTVARVTLEYTRIGEAVQVDISDAAVAKTVDEYVKSWGRHGRIMKAGEFLVKESTLCGWCGLVATCPTAAAGGKVDRKGGLPTALQLPLRVISADEKVSLLETETTHSQPVPGDSQGMSETSEITATAELVKGPEGRPWERTVIAPDGSHVLNPGSYEYQGAFGATSMAMQLLTGAKLPDGSKVPMNNRTLTGLAATLLRMSSEVQKQWLGGVDVMAGSHTRCRGAVATVTETLPPPFGGDSADWDNWVQAGIKRASAITNTVTAVVSGVAPAYPWLSLASDGDEVRENRIAADKLTEADANREAVAEAVAEVIAEAALVPEPAPPVDVAAPIEATPSALGDMAFDF